MQENNHREICAIILAAGKGKRMKNEDINKVTIRINKKPLIAYSVQVLEELRIKPIIIVTGHAEHTVKKALQYKNITYAKQDKQLGTGHAALQAIPKIPANITDVIILYGDDSYLYKKELLSKIINMHLSGSQEITFLTILVDDPTGLGRIIRDSNNHIKGIVEEKDADSTQKKIKEINPNVYIFKASFIKKYLPLISQSSVTGEYYLPTLIDLAYDSQEKIEALEGGKIPWQGINTSVDLKIAEKLIKSN